MGLLLVILNHLFSWLVFIWCIVAGIRMAYRKLPPFGEFLYQEIHPLCPYMIACLALHIALIDGKQPFVAAIDFAIWCYCNKQDDGDGRWKKRRKKIASKIRESAGKLVVTPLPQGA